MNHTAPIREPAIRPIALDRLSVAPENVRKTPPAAAAEAELKASIATHGLLENLVVRTDGPNGGYAVVAGGRRLAALKALAADGALDAAHPVPCLVVDGDAMSVELSLAENVIRIAMHPADHVTAFTKLAESGVTAPAIAARFGMSERLVEQRLRLGNAAPELIEAYRADEIDLETLKAFAVTTDHRRRMAVWEQVANQGYRPAAWQVKRLLTEERVPANSSVARFVGVDAYEAAGGPVLRDLFAAEDESGVWFEDPALLNKLATAKLGQTVKDLATRWHWAAAMLEVDWTSMASYGRIHPEPATPTDQETAEIERLRAREDELDNLGEDDWTEALAEEAEAIETRTCEIHATIEARATYRAEDYAIAGCIAMIGRDGELQVIQGLVRAVAGHRRARDHGRRSALRRQSRRLFSPARLPPRRHRPRQRFRGRTGRRTPRPALRAGVAATVIVPEGGDFNDDLAALGAAVLAARLGPFFRFTGVGEERA